MKLPELNSYGSRLKVFISGDVYAMDMFRGFDSVQELANYMEKTFGVTRKDFSYFY